MKEKSRSKEELMNEIKILKRRIGTFEKSCSGTKPDKPEDKYRAIFENAADAIFLIEPKTHRIVDCNPKASKITGYTARELSEMKIEDLHPPKEVALLSNIIKTTSEGNSNSGRCRTNQQKKNGDLVPVEISTSIARVKGKKYVMGLVTDIAERKTMETNLLHANEEWEQTFDAIPDMIAVIDSRFRIRKANKAWADKLGMNRRKLIHSLCYKVFHGTNEPPEYCPRHKAVSVKNELGSEIFEKRLKNHFYLSSAPIMDQDGRMTGFVEIARDISERMKLEEQLKAAAITDELTGLFNRRGFFTLSEQQCKIADRTKRGLALLYMDLNGLKRINDEFGHRIGDQALIDTAKILRKTFRNSDIKARIGGDEFAVLLTDPTSTDIEDLIISHLQMNLRIHNNRSGHNYKITVSSGISHFDPSHPCSVSDLLSRADELMYMEKKLSSKDDVIVRPGMENVEHRRYERFKIPGIYQAEIDGSLNAGIKDISFGGVRVKTSRELVANSTHQVIFPGIGKRKVSSGSLVVWSSLKTSDDSLPYYESGLKFTTMSGSSKKSLTRLLLSLT